MSVSNFLWEKGWCDPDSGFLGRSSFILREVDSLHQTFIKKWNIRKLRMNKYLLQTGLSSAFRRYRSFDLIFISRVLSPHGCIKHWQWNKDKADNFGDKTLTFFNSSSPSLLGRSLVHGKWVGQPRLTRSWAKDSLLKVARKFSQMSQHSSYPLQAPTARLFTSSQLPSWLAGWQINETYNKNKKEKVF